jgi:hypothetical protein
LPVELLIAIFYRIHASSNRDLVSCIGCSQYWKGLAEPILWKNIFLKFHDSRRFSAQVGVLSNSEEGRRKLNAVRCLRVAVPGDGRDYTGGVYESDSGGKSIHRGPPLGAAYIFGRPGAAYILASGIADLASALPHLSNLQTFLIMVYNGMRMNGPEDFLGSIPNRGKTAGPYSNIFATLIDVLPPSVTDLYLDLSDATKNHFQLAPCQICPAVTRVLPRLEHLALYLRTCCDHILVPANPRYPDSPKLKSVIMRLQGFQTKDCGFRKIGGRWRQVEFDINQYTAKIQNARKDGFFPSLKSFLVISKRRPVDHQDLACKWAVYVKDLACNETAVFPRVFLEQPQALDSGNTRTSSPRAFIRFPTRCSFLPTRRLGKEYVGGCGGIRRLVRFWCISTTSQLTSI